VEEHPLVLLARTRKCRVEDLRGVERLGLPVREEPGDLLRIVVVAFLERVGPLRGDDLAVGVEHREERAQDRRLADATFIESQMTAREVEILGMVVAGLTNQQIATRLHLSAGTVRNRLGHLFPKLDVVNRAQAAARAVELGLVDPSGV
jgi:DNA-binding CsgD family transcriptional regulator